MKLIIDADSIVYKTAGAAQTRNQETGVMEYYPVTYAYQNAKTLMNKILDKCSSTNYEAYLTASKDSTSFRKVLYPEYKANRKAGQRPRYYQEVREYLVKHWKAAVVSEIEADDAVTMAQYKEYDNSFKEELKPACLVGIDKDLDQVPGWHYNYDKDHMYYISPLQGCKNFYKQVLEGDKSDNIPRIKYKWEKKQAFRLIDLARTEKEVKEIVCREIEKCGKIPAEELQWRGSLLYLRRYEEDRWKYE